MLSQTIKGFREKNRLTQEQFSRSLQIDKSYLSKLENDRAHSPPSRALLEKIIAITGCDRAIIYQSGRIDDLKPIFEDLAKEYQGFLAFLRKMHGDPDFAKGIFDSLE
jgi:transcriptional regulator with XRE-family HTH domain